MTPRAGRGRRTGRGAARIHTASGRSGSGRGRQVAAGRRSRGSRTTGRRAARPPAPPRARRRRRRPTTSTRPPACRRTSPARRAKVSETSSSSSQPTIERRPGPLARAAAVEPEAARVRGRDVGKNAHRRQSCRRPSRRSPRKLATSSGAVLAEHRLGVELHALQRQRRGAAPPITVAVVAARGHHQARRAPTARPASGSAPPEALRQPGEHAAPSWRHRRHVAVRGRDAVDHAAVRRHQALHAEADAEHRHGRRRAAPRGPTAKSAGSSGVPGPGESTTWEKRQHVGGADARRAGRRPAARRSPRRRGARGSRCRSRGGRPRRRPARRRPPARSDGPGSSSSRTTMSCSRS